MATLNQIWDYQDRLFSFPISLSDGQAINLDLRGLLKLTLVPTGGGTVTYSFVDSLQATQHDPDTDQAVTVPTVVPVDWPFYRISVSGGGVRISAV